MKPSTQQQPALPACFDDFNRLEARCKQDKNRHSVRDLPAHIVVLENGLSPRAWFESLGETCSTPELQVNDSEGLQLSVSETAVYIFIPMDTGSELPGFATHPIHSWLSQHRRHHRVSALHLVLHLKTALSAPATPASQSMAWLSHCKRMLNQLKGRHRRHAPVIVHLCTGGHAEFAQPELMLDGKQLLGQSAHLAWQQWRIQTLHAQDMMADPSTGFSQTSWLIDQDSGEAAFHAFCKGLRLSVRHAKGVSPALLLIHPTRSGLSQRLRDALNAIPAKRQLLHTVWNPTLLWFAAASMVIMAYCASSAWRAKALDANASHLEDLAQQLDRAGCDDVSHLNLAATLQTQSHAHIPGVLLATQSLYPHQRRRQEQMLQSTRHSAVRWTVRCLLKPADAALLAELGLYLQLPRTQRGTAATLEEAYQTLKAVLMLRQRRHLDRAFLLPRIRPILLSLHKGKGLALETVLSQQAADTLLDGLMADTANSTQPWQPAATELIASVRSALRNAQQPITPGQQQLRPLLDLANSKERSFSLLQSLGDPVQAWLTTDSLIPAAYAPGAYFRHIQSAVQSPTALSMAPYDWVLDLHGNPGTDPNLQQGAPRISTQYWQQHRDIWLQSLESIRVVRTLTTEHNRAMLAAFADVANNPVFACVRALQQTGQPVFENLTQQLGIPDSTRSASGQGSDAGDNWATYRSLLQALAQTSPLMTEEENRLFVAKQVLDPASHLNRLSDWTNLQTQSVKDDRLRLALRRFMRLPVQAWALHQLRISTRNLNGLWASDTVPRLKSVTTRFPFSPAGVDASPDEIAEFLHQGNGALSQFRQRYLQAGHNTLSLQDKDRLLVPLRLDPDFNALMSRLQLLRHADITTDKLSAFELTAQPNPALTEQTFSMDAQTLRYRNGPQIPQVFLWQGQSPSLTIHINGQTQHGQVCQAMTFSGRMAWIRALQAAHVTRRGADWLLHWTPCADKTSQVSFLYRHLSGLNPSDISLLERWPIPLAIFKDTPE